MVAAFNAVVIEVMNRLKRLKELVERSKVAASKYLFRWTLLKCTWPLLVSTVDPFHGRHLYLLKQEENRCD